MFESEKVQDGCVKVADVKGILNDVVREVVGLTVDGSAFGAATGHPHRKATGMVVAAIVGFGESTLRVNSAAEFTTPDNEGVFKHAALLEVFDEGVTGLVNVLALAGHATVNV